MSAFREAAPTAQQPRHFAFNPANLKRAQAIIAKYPAGRQQSAVMPLLDIAQRQNDGWVSIAAMQYIAEMLKIPYIRVYEVATFYTMFNLKPVGKYLVQVCRTTPCWLRGSDELTHACESHLGIGLHENTKDGNFTLMEVECLGACVNAPMVQINDDYYEDLTPARLVEILDALKAGKHVPVGTQVKRLNSAPITGLTSLGGKPAVVVQKAEPKVEAKKPAAKKSPVKKPMAKKSVGKKPAAKPVKKAAAKKPAVKKPAAKKVNTKKKTAPKKGKK